jgi:hypothetical protein
LVASRQVQVIDLRDTCQPDSAADRAASAARTLAAVAHDAARENVKRDAVTPEADGADAKMMPVHGPWLASHTPTMPLVSLDDAERERQNRLRRWQALPYPNRKGG